MGHQAIQPREFMPCRTVSVCRLSRIDGRTRGSGQGDKDNTCRELLGLIDRSYSKLGRRDPGTDKSTKRSHFGASPVALPA
ncbi:hypothetical protein GCM10007858_54910 [Bradyrhizobium liaoningense]|nr:hypothetical protein GCM10007858_54910 [Bradyrhizobium liaoningense]